MSDIFEKSNIKNNNLNNNQDNQDKDSIPMRIQFIKNLLEGKDLQPLVNFDSTDTENFVCRNFNDNNNDNESGDSYDTRVVLKKRILDFKNVIQQIGGKLKYIKSGTTGHTFKGIFIIPSKYIFILIKFSFIPLAKINFIIIFIQFRR